MLKEKLYYLFKNSSFRNNFIELCIKQFISAFLGFILALFLTNILAFAIAIAVFIVIVFITSAILSSKQHQFDLLEILKEEQKKSHWKEIIRLGYPLSRPLWLSGRYELRAEIGEIIKTAASHLEGDVKIGKETFNSKYILVSVLIDDLGWTRFVLGQSSKATKNILEGIRIAEENNIWDLAIKGNRHLIGIFSENGNFKEIDTLLKKIHSLMEKVDESSKLEIQAGLLFSQAESYSYQHEYDKAIGYLKDAQQLYLQIEDYERYVKSFDLLAEAYMAQGGEKYTTASITINEGIEAAVKWERRERYIKLIILAIRLKTKIVLQDDCYTKSEYFNDKVSIEDQYKQAIEACNGIQNELFVMELKKEYKTFSRVASKKIKKMK